MLNVNTENEKVFLCRMICKNGIRILRYFRVGKGKFDGKYHLYDIKTKKDTARRDSGVGRLREFLRQNGIFQQDHITGEDKSQGKS